MNSESLKMLEERFFDFIVPLLDENDAEDFHIAWEFQKFLHMKKLKVLTGERENLKKWKQALLSR